MWYTLDEKNDPVKANSIIEFVKWQEENPEKYALKQEEIGDYYISTVFLGLDRSRSEDKEPVLWETMIFHNENQDYQERYTSRNLAIEGHQRAVDSVKNK